MTPRRAAGLEENPLVPHAVLRSLFGMMTEARIVEQMLRPPGRQRTSGFVSIRGEEACRAAATACLRDGDLVSDPSLSPASDRMLGVSLRELRDAHRSGSAGDPVARRRLPRETTAREQIATALGAAHALRLSSGQSLVCAYVQANLASREVWRQQLALAGARRLPVLFLILPERSRSGAFAPGALGGVAQSWGVPGIPVDVADAVALYRVVQEATLRARAGDGPTLIECVRWQVAGEARRPGTDPLLALSLSLVARGAGSPEWQQRTTETLRRRAGALLS